MADTTQATADKTELKQFLWDGLLSLVQAEANYKAKAKELRKKEAQQVTRRRQAVKDAEAKIIITGM